MVDVCYYIHMMMTQTETVRSVYHVLGRVWDGGDLRPWDEQTEDERGAWKWDADEGFDGDVVSFFGSLSEAQQAIRELPEFRTTAQILRVDVDRLPRRLTRNDEGYLVHYGSVPAEALEEIGR